MHLAITILPVVACRSVFLFIGVLLMSVRVEKLSRAMMRRSIRLLDMEYKPSEIAEELSASKAQVIRLISAGAPARKDAKGHYWIHGEKFANWLENAAPKTDKDKTVYAENEIYCIACRKITTYTIYRLVKNVAYGECLQGHKVTRFISTKPTRNE